MGKKVKDDNVEEVDVKETPSPKGANIWTLRNLLSFLEKGTEVSSISQNFYEFSADGCHMKVPVRAQTITSQPLLQQKIINFGLDWGYDGTITTPIDPFVGLSINTSTFAELSYDSSTPWQGVNHFLSHGGRMYHVIENNIRANNTISAADMLKMVMALLAYDEIARSIMLFLTYYNCRLDGNLNLTLSTILSSSGGDPMFSSRDDLLGQIIANVQESFFPYKFFDFWKNRSYQAFSIQAPWYKYGLFVPNDQMHYKAGMTRLFDAFISTQQYTHPETFLKTEGLWNSFVTDLVPLLFNKVGYQTYIGGNPVSYLQNIGWTPISYDHVQIEWILNKFWLHPFDEYLGIGQNELPKHGVTDAVTNMNAYYWNGSTLSSTGRVFYLGQDAYLEDNGSNSVIQSPWLDPVRFVGVARNYEAANDACNDFDGQTVKGGLNYVGDTYTDLSYGEWMALFKRLAFGFQDFELAEPDPDININAQIATDGFSVNWMEHMLYRDVFKFPFTMPDRHWYFSPKKLDKMYSMFLNLQRDDVELYKLQRPRDAANLSPDEADGGKGRF